MFFQGEFDRAMDLYRESARLDPDLESNKTAIRQLRTVKGLTEDAGKCVFNRDFKNAVVLYSSAMQSCGQLPKLAPLHA